MFLQIYQTYIVKNFLLIVLKTTLVFLSLILIMGIFEELSFFTQLDVKFYLPIILVLMNSLSVLYLIFPFIFLIGAQFFFIQILESNELIAFKSYGLSNNKILGIIAVSSFFTGIIIVSVFYNLSAVLKFKYIDLKNAYTLDNRYLASITENGLWIKDEKDKMVYFINADTISANKLENIDILVFDDNFTLSKTIFSKEADISNKEWIMNEALIIRIDGNREVVKNYSFFSNFDYIKINNLYSDLSALTIFDLIKLRKDYEAVQYSTTEIDIHIKRLISYPFFLTVMTIFSSIIMLNIKHQKPKIFYTLGGVLLSVLIYYINFFFVALGKNEQIPIMLSIWLPIIILSIISLIGTARLNEK
jgi:lipopolysaccharide export system permease protein